MAHNASHVSSKTLHAFCNKGVGKALASWRPKTNCDDVGRIWFSKFLLLPDFLDPIKKLWAQLSIP